MNLLRSRSPSPQEQGQAARPEPDVARVQGINIIMEALGVSPSRASTHIHSRPEAMHIIAPADLRYLVEHAPLLAEHPDVKCDFPAFSLVLWAILGRVDAKLDEAAMLLSAEAATTAAMSTGGGNDRKSAGVTCRQLFNALYSHLVQAGRVTLILRTFEVPHAHGLLQKKLRVAKEDVELLLRITRKLAQLLSEMAEEPPAAAAEGAGQHRNESSNKSGGTSGISVVQRYDREGHMLMRVTESALGSLWLLLSALISRTEVDVVPVLALLNDELQWRVSGLGEAGTESYCRAVAALPQCLFSRRADFENGDEAAAGIIFQRLARRPAFSWRTFKLLHYTAKTYATMGQTPLPHEACYGMLLCFAHTQAILEQYITSEGAEAAIRSTSHADEQAGRKALRKRVAVAKATRAALSRYIAQLIDQYEVKRRHGKHEGGLSMNETSSGELVCSFGQLLVLAAVNGMPEADFTDDAALLRRATATALTKEESVLRPDFLRLLLGYAYIMPTSKDEVEHARLTNKATVALYHSVAKYFFQETQFEEALKQQDDSQRVVTPVVNPLFTNPVLNSVRLMRLLVSNSVDSVDEAEAQEGEEGETGGEDHQDRKEHLEGEAALQQAVNRQQQRVLPVEDAARIADKVGHTSTMKHLVKTTIDVIYECNDRLHQFAAQTGDDASGTLFSSVPDAVKSVSASAATLLFFFLDSPGFLKQVNSLSTLGVLARIFALQATITLRRGASDQARKARQELLVRMQRRLAYVPQNMCARDVQSILLTRLVPLAHPSKVAVERNRLRLALLEAYLRSMATSAAAFSIPDDMMLSHWVDVALPCMTNKRSAALATAGHDFFIAPFLAQKTVSPLFVPTYVAVLIPTNTGEQQGGSSTTASKYGEPALPLVKRFAAMVRTACQGLERCDATALQVMLSDGNSAVSRAAGTVAAAWRVPSLKKLSPTNAVLLVVSALFDKLCMLWNSAPGYVPEAQQRFATYFSALANLLQCTSTQVLHRVCASIEALEVEHLHGAAAVQMQFLKYVGLVVDNVRGNSKKGVAEWFLRLSEKITKETKRTSKL